MVKKFFTALLFVFFTASIVSAGNNPFTVEFEEVNIPGAPNVHSFIFAQSNGKWLIMGGRTNGLHGFTPISAFPNAYWNKYAYVIDPNSNQVWSRELALDLPFGTADPLRSTNQQYIQVGNNLYVTGGYGLDSSVGQAKTFAKLTVIDVDGMINAVINSSTVSPFVKQATDSRVQVTGGEMGYMDGFVYLYGGHNFTGVYWNTGQGNNNQVYTDSYKKFQVSVAGSTVSINNYSQVTDTNNLHRRDMNLVHAIKPDGSEYLINYGGVFRKGVDLPFLNPIVLDGSGISLNSFEQKYNQYTTAQMNLFDSTTMDMHSMFFGGMGMWFYDTVNSVTQVDSMVPFTSDISLMTRNAGGVFSETLYPNRMPGFLGSNAKFVLNPSIPQYDNGVIKMREINARTFVGYIYGGIKATSQHPGTSGMGSSSASDIILKVYIRPFWVGIQNISSEVPDGYNLSQNYPNPFNPSTKIRFAIPQAGQVKLNVYNAIGQKVTELVNSNLSAGTYESTWDAQNIAGGVYFYKLETEGYSETKKMLLVK